MNINKYTPTSVYKTIFDIDYNELYAQGKRYILTDLDNTLASYDVIYATEEVINWFNNLKEIGFTVLIISNNNKKRIKTFLNGLEIPFVSRALKPLKKGFKKALKILNFYEKDKMISIGDQIVTDVCGANKFGIDSILVKPIKRKTEKWYTKLFNRRIQNRAIKKMKIKNPRMYEEIMIKHES